VLIDGSHGFPAPVIDWYYGAGRLRRGGVVVVDDLELPAVRVLVDFLERDPRWRSIRHTEKWAAYERQSEGSLTEEWVDQPFYALPEQGRRRRVTWAEARARRLLRPVKGFALRRLRA
jgi:hypothetical protein